MLSNRFIFAIYPHLSKIYQHPFNMSLYNGTLSKDVFYYFLVQDQIYLYEFSKALLHTSTKLTKNEHQKIFIQLSNSIFREQENIHKKYLPQSEHINFFTEQKNNIAINQAVSNYIKHIQQTTQCKSIPEAVASLTPCFYLYSKVGLWMQQQKTIPNNPYQIWINSYSSSSFKLSTKLIIDVVNETSKQKNHHDTKQIVGAFLESTQHEITFWDSVYQKNKLQADILLPRALSS